MSFLTTLIERHRVDGAASLPLLDPRLPSRFEPVVDTASPHGIAKDVAIEASPDADGAPPPVRPPASAAPLPAPHGDAFADLDPRLSLLRAAMSAAQATVEVPAFAATPGAPWVASPRTAEGPPTSAAGPSSPEAGESIPALSTRRPERPRALALEPARDRSPAPPVSPTVHVEREPTTPRDPPTIHVSIGRVDVRAIMTPAVPPARPPAASERLSLEDYLQGRHRGAR